MKKVLLTFCVIIIGLFACAQTEFAPINAEWFYNYGWEFEIPPNRKNIKP